MSQYATMHAQYNLPTTREDGVQVYERRPDPIGGGGLLPEEIRYTYLDTDDNGDLYPAYTDITSTDNNDDYADLRAALRRTSESAKNIRMALPKNRKSLATEHRDTAIGFFLAAVFYTASIPLGIKSKNATQNAMKDPTVIQQVEERAWDKITNQTSDNVSKRIKALKPGETFSYTADEKLMLESRNKLRDHSLREKAQSTHHWDSANWIFGVGAPLLFGTIGLFSLKNMFKTAAQNARLRKFGRENERTQAEIRIALGRLGYEPDKS